jgi:hypothetical protein
MAAALVVAVAGSAGLVAAAEDEPTTAEERDAVREQLAEEASELDALRATDEEITAALDALEADVRTQQARAEDAQAEADRAADEAQRALTEEQGAEDQRADVEVRLSDLAVDSYMGAGSSEPLFDILSSDDLDEGFRRQALTDIAAGNEADLLDEMAALEEDARIAREAADEASQRADEARAAAEQQLADLEAAQARKEAFAAEVDTRIEASLAEAAVLQDQDAELSAEIAAQQAALAAQAGGGGASGPLPPVGNVSLTSVRGIVVATSIAGQLEGLLSAASAAGINFSGGGFRDPAAQIAVRRSNCGTSNYAIYEMPASACSPPTARPGTSLHERGLAIDFSANGSLITSRGSSAFQWLAANASRFGFYNLPSEPWHWSTTGG